MRHLLGALESLSNDEEVDTRVRFYARELRFSSLASLSIAGTKHSMVVDSFTEESVTSAQSALPENHPAKNWPLNTFLRKLLHDAVNEKVPDLIRREFPPLVGGECRAPVIYGDIAYNFHPRLGGKSLLLLAECGGGELYADFVKRSQESTECLGSDEAVFPSREFDGEQADSYSGSLETMLGDGLSYPSSSDGDSSLVTSEEESEDEEQSNRGGSDTNEEEEEGHSLHNSLEGPMEATQDVMDLAEVDDLDVGGSQEGLPEGEGAGAPVEESGQNDKLNHLETCVPVDEFASPASFAKFMVMLMKSVDNFHSGRHACTREEQTDENGLISFLTRHVLSGVAIGGQVYSDALKNLMSRQTTNAWRDIIGLATAIAKYLREGRPSPEVKEKIITTTEKIDVLMSEVKSNFASSQGCGVRVETWVQLDGVFNPETPNLCLPNPPLMPMIMVNTSDLSDLFAGLTEMYWRPLRKAFPARVCTYENLVVESISPAAKTTLVLFAEIIEMQFAATPFQYKGTIVKSIWSDLMESNSAIVDVPEHLRLAPNDFEKNTLKLPFVVEPHLMLLPTFEDAIALLEDMPLPGEGRQIRRTKAMGLAAGEAMARAQGSLLKGSTALSVSYESFSAAAKKIFFAFSVIGMLSPCLCPLFFLVNLTCSAPLLLFGLGRWMESGHGRNRDESSNRLAAMASSDDTSVDKLIREFIEAEDEILFGDGNSFSGDDGNKPEVPHAPYFGVDDDVVAGLASLPKPYRARLYTLVFRLVARVHYKEDTKRLWASKKHRECLREDREAFLGHAPATPMVPTTAEEHAQWDRFPKVRREVLKLTNEAPGNSDIIRKSLVVDHSECLHFLKIIGPSGTYNCFSRFSQRG